ncbi:MAG: YceD family protein [Deltaproteobacteria bacterium]
MKIFVGELTRGILEQKEFEFCERINDLEFAEDGIKLLTPVKLIGIIRNESGILKLNGTMDFKLELKCSRCLKELNKDFSLRVNESFSSAEGIPEDFYKFAGNEIDLTEMVLDVIITSIPMKSLCSEECKGLCSFCGNNLNNKACACKDEDYDPRFEKLRQLKNNL